MHVRKAEAVTEQDVSAGPVATIELPQRVPLGVHGNWFEK